MIKTVAEIGINHNGNVDIAKELIKNAVESGCTHVKFQKRNPEVCVPEWKKKTRRETPWGEMSYLEYKHKIEFQEEEFNKIFGYCDKLGIDCFASVWDVESVEFMAEYTNIGKIPSAHLTNHALVEYARDTFDILILSTGMSTEHQIGSTLMKVKPDVVMHSVSSYPSNVEDLNLNYIKRLKDHKFKDVEIGYSGHEMELETVAAAVALGATWIERHVTLSRDMWGSDQSSSLEPREVSKMVEYANNIEKSLGSGGPRTILECEKSKKKSLRK